MKFFRLKDSLPLVLLAFLFVALALSPTGSARTSLDDFKPHYNPSNISAVDFEDILICESNYGKNPNYNSSPSSDSIEVTSSGSKINLKVAFPAPEITVSESGYHRVRMDGLKTYGNPGEPKLPVKPVRVLIPFNKKVKEVSVSSGEKVVLDGSYRVEIAQKPVPILENKSPSPGLQSYYERAHDLPSPFPVKDHSDCSIGSKMGYRVKVLRLYPVKYYPEEGKLSYFKKMTVEVNLKPSTRTVRGPSLRRSTKAKETISRMVDNPNTINTYSQQSTEPLTEESSLSDSQSYQYVVITSESLLNGGKPYTFDNLIATKKAKGITATIVTVENIYANYSGVRPDGNVDNQTKIRNFIKDAYNSWGTEYVLLGGDGDKGNAIIPPREFYVDLEQDYNYIASDMYYSCLDGSWDNDADGNYGEPGEADPYTEVHVGRAPVDSAQEVSNFVAKTLAYQQSNGDYLSKVLMVGEQLDTSTWGGDYKNEIKNGTDNHGYATTGFENSAYAGLFDTRGLYEKNQSWSDDNLVEKIDNGLHMVNHAGHANVSYLMKLSSWEVDELTNSDYFIGYTHGCYCGSFDNITTDGSTVHDDSIIEHFICGENGAVAFVANSRFGWFVPGSTDAPSQHFDREFWDAILGENLFKLGEANSDSKEDQDWYWYGTGGDDYGRWCAYETNLFGDPELSLRLPKVKAEISPGKNTGLPGRTLNYTVTVCNGDHADNYVLENSDTLGWDLSLSSQLLNMQPYEERDVSLSVEIPSNAVDTEDIINVIVTSKENSQISDNVSCAARVPPARSVDVSAVPKENYGLPGWHVKFQITAVNTGIENDNYELEARDNIWSASLSDNLFTGMESIYDNGESKTTTLTVTIPKNAELTTEDRFNVVATSQENENVIDNSISCTVYCGTHNPIHIRGDENFTMANGIASGSGTENDPYIIENWIISAENANGIEIENTTANFVIRNCVIENGGDSHYGVSLENVENGQIINCTVKNNGYGGIRLWNSLKNKLENNYVFNNEAGIYLRRSSSNNRITNNHVANNAWPGIELYGDCNHNRVTNNYIANNEWVGIWSCYSSSLVIENNDLENDGILISGINSNVSDFDTHMIENNTTNGRAIYYFSNRSGVTAPENAGEVIFADCLGVTIENLEISNSDIGIELAYTDNSLLLKNQLFNNDDAGIYLLNSSRNTIENNITSNNERQGIQLEYSANNKIVKNDVSSNGWSGVKLFGSSNNKILNNQVSKNNSGVRIESSSDNNLVYHNNFENNETQAYDEGSNYWDDGYPSGGNYWSDYTGEDLGNDGVGDTPYQILGDSNEDHYPLMNPYHNPIYIDGSSDFSDGSNDGVLNPGASGTENDPYIIENWFINAENANGIEIQNMSAHFVIRNCFVKNGWEAYYDGIYLNNVINGRIENNTCENNRFYGIHLWYSTNNTLNNNTCEKNSHGIRLYHSPYNTLDFNTCSNNIGDGIRIYDSDNNLVSNNLLKNNSYCGIYLPFSDNNILKNNICPNNSTGISLSDSSNNTLSNNTCENNDWYGIDLRGSDNNLLYHNNLINNEDQAYDNGSNQWDNGYSSGGNYWSDYTGGDNYSGVNQDESGSDGIGDTPYSIKGDNNQDNYPLMESWQEPTPEEQPVGGVFHPADREGLRERGADRMPMTAPAVALVTLIAVLAVSVCLRGRGFGKNPR